MLIRKAFRFRLRTNSAFEKALSLQAGHARFVWNKALDLNLNRLKDGVPLLWYRDLAGLLQLWKQSDEYGFLVTAHSQALQQRLMDLDRAFRDAFDREQPGKRLPVFKKKGFADGFRYPQGFKLDEANSRIYLPKLGWVCYRQSRGIEGTPKQVTVSRASGHWYVSIQTEIEIGTPRHPASSSVGIDLGVARFATLSDGVVFPPLNSFKKHQLRLARYQRAMSRKQKFSNNWKKAKARVQKLHQKIGNSRRDYLHKLTTTISQNHAIVCIEDLQVRNMSKSAAGTVDQPGRNVSAKSGLNRSILDQGWFEFRRQLEYKQAWRGGWLIAVPPPHTSQECPVCHHTEAGNRRTQAHFRCVVCDFEENADLVGAINILSRGMQILRDEGQDTTDASVGRETAARIACEVNGAVRPSAAGTHRDGGESRLAGILSL